MWSPFTLFLILHILAVIVAFGPTFAFPLMGGMIAKNPQWALPWGEAMHKIDWDRRRRVPQGLHRRSRHLRRSCREAACS
jgi:hypothetical protein